MVTANISDHSAGGAGRHGAGSDEEKPFLV